MRNWIWKNSILTATKKRKHGWVRQKHCISGFLAQLSRCAFTITFHKPYMASLEIWTIGLWAVEPLDYNLIQMDDYPVDSSAISPTAFLYCETQTWHAYNFPICIHVVQLVPYFLICLIAAAPLFVVDAHGMDYGLKGCIMYRVTHVLSLYIVCPLVSHKFCQLTSGISQSITNTKINAKLGVTREASRYGNKCMDRHCFRTRRTRLVC